MEGSVTINTRNVETKKLYNYLLQEATKPYYGMLKEWICYGRLVDPFNEFMIEERKLNKDRLRIDFNDSYWEQRYTLQLDAIPTYLEPYKQKVLLTGKYLNVLRECKLEVVELPLDCGYIEMIEEGYAQSNKILLDLLRLQNDFVGRLKSIKTFFLMGQSDYLNHFLDLASKHLTKPLALVSLSKVSSILDAVINGSSDPYKDDVTIELSTISLFDQLDRINSISITSTAVKAANPIAVTGIDSLTLNYNVAFPLSLALNKKIITKYQMLFRHLFKCKYLERLVSMGWLEEAKERKKTNSLRSKLLHFLNQITYFMFFQVIDPNWNTMIDQITKATTVEQVLKSHEDFLDTCLKECMLTNPRLISVP